jgi:hypothetical protein
MAYLHDGSVPVNSLLTACEQPRRNCVEMLATEWAVRVLASDLGLAAKVVVLAAVLHQRGNTAQLAAASGVSERTVQYAKLEGRDWVRFSPATKTQPAVYEPRLPGEDRPIILTHLPPAMGANDAPLEDAKGTFGVQTVQGIASNPANGAPFEHSKGANGAPFDLPKGANGAPDKRKVSPTPPSKENTTSRMDRVSSTTEKEEEGKPKIAKFSRSAALEAFGLYNASALRLSLPQAAKLTPDRERRIIARLKEHGFEGWRQALDQLARSAFLRGKNDRGWTASLDFLLQPSSFAKVHDGVYADEKGAPVDHAAEAAARKAIIAENDRIERLIQEGKLL